MSHVRRVIGVDVGGTKISVASLEGGTLAAPELHHTDTSSSQALVEQLVGAIRAAGPADAVGLGVPSVIEFASGTARHSVNIPLEGVPLRQLLTERLGIPAYIDNDANVAALAEAYDDDLRPLAGVLVMITVGTGIGGGIVLNGRVFRGATGAAPELGHIIVGADLRDGAPAPLPRAPQPGSLELLASGRALDQLGRERDFADGSAVVDSAQDGDESALEALRIHGERLGIGIANVVEPLRPRPRRHRGRRVARRRAPPRARPPLGPRLHPPRRRHADRDPHRPLRPPGRRARRGPHGPPGGAGGLRF